MGIVASESRSEALTILQVTHQGGGAGSTQSILELSRRLAARGHRVLVACREEVLLARWTVAAGLEHVPIRIRPLSLMANDIEQAIRRHGVDVVNSHATRDRRALTWLRWRGRLPQAFVVTRRTMPGTWFPEILAVGATADRTIAVSGAVARALARKLQPQERLRVVPNGVALERLARADAAPELERARALLEPIDGRRVITVLARRKDQEVMIRALSHIEIPSILALVGIDPEPGLRRLTASVPERHRVVIVPFTDHPLSFYRLADVAALPSRIEGFSAALLEAMAMGLPVVASDSGGNRDLIQNEATGLLVRPMDPRDWALALASLLEDPDRATRLGRAGREHVRAELTVEHTTARTEAVYREALSRRSGRKPGSLTSASHTPGRSEPSTVTTPR